jgi:quercetin dioxygenase-like cupin family protein
MQEMRFTPISTGKLKGSIYDAAETGELLPMHTHDEATVHITIIARGSFKAHGDGWEMTAKAGDVIDWKVGQSHELIALEPNSRFVNIVKGV